MSIARRSSLFVAALFLVPTLLSASGKPGRTLRTDRVTNLPDTIEHAKAEAGASDMETVLIVWARGIQAYELSSMGWQAKGPLADLFPVRVHSDGTVRLARKKVGAHYQHLATPAWEFADGRVIAQQAESISGASSADVAWLNVDLLPNELGYRKILRIETRAGLAPNNTNFLKGVRLGIGYETLYVFLR